MSATSPLLLVEPDVVWQQLLSRRLFLSGLDFSLVPCRTAAEAWKVASKILPALVITELTLPDQSGLVLIGRFRSFSRLAALPIIVLTHQTSRQAVESCLEQGVSIFLPKNTVRLAEVATVAASHLKLGLVS